MTVIACGRCAACDGEKGHEFCENPVGPGQFIRCGCGRVFVVDHDETRAALEALVAGVEDRCELHRRCDIAACNCGNSHLTELGERVRRARRVLGWEVTE